MGGSSLLHGQDLTGSYNLIMSYYDINYYIGLRLPRNKKIPPAFGLIENFGLIWTILWSKSIQNFPVFPVAKGKTGQPFPGRKGLASNGE
jgi:hypothetical protein